MAAVVLPTDAWAAKPVKETTVSGPFVVSEESCGFAVAVQPLRDKLRIFTFSDGREMITASYVATATNLDTGKTLKLNLSGQGVFKVNPDGSSTLTTTGKTLLFDPGSLQLVSGPIVFEFDVNGAFVSRTIVGNGVKDICAALSDV